MKAKAYSLLAVISLVIISTALTRINLQTLEIEYIIAPVPVLDGGLFPQRSDGLKTAEKILLQV